MLEESVSLKLASDESEVGSVEVAGFISGEGELGGADSGDGRKIGEEVESVSGESIGGDSWEDRVGHRHDGVSPRFSDGTNALTKKVSQSALSNGEKRDCNTIVGGEVARCGPLDEDRREVVDLEEESASNQKGCEVGPEVGEEDTRAQDEVWSGGEKVSASECGPILLGAHAPEENGLPNSNCGGPILKPGLDIPFSQVVSSPVNFIHQQSSKLSGEFLCKVPTERRVTKKVNNHIRFLQEDSELSEYSDSVDIQIHDYYLSKQKKKERQRMKEGCKKFNQLGGPKGVHFEEQGVSKREGRKRRTSVHQLKEKILLESKEGRGDMGNSQWMEGRVEEVSGNVRLADMAQAAREEVKMLAADRLLGVQKELGFSFSMEEEGRITKNLVNLEKGDVDARSKKARVVCNE